MKKTSIFSLVFIMVFLSVGFFVGDVYTVDTWCLTENKCDSIGEGPCPGAAYTTKEECEAAVKPAAEGTATATEEAKKYECKPPDCTPLKNPLGDVNAIPVIFGNVIKVVTGLMGSAALLVFIYGGVMWILSGGNQERIKKGQQAMIWAAIGIVVVFSSYAIITLVIEGMGAL
ncbi:hypothetical protein C0581_04060 [Candidatus Parcubacteria bacterium]|nr:MAG: hypothetical protein C0581_04060 [Candidatus Parcubacteria bacterium]